MEIIGLEISAVSLLVALILMARRRRAAVQVKSNEFAARGAQAVQDPELAQQIFVPSLDILHKRVESLAARIALAERQLSKLVDGPQFEHHSEFESSPRLLEYGQEQDRLTGQIDLPLGTGTRDRTRQEPIDSEDKSGTASAARAAAEIVDATNKHSEPRQHRARPQPLLLIDVVVEGGPVASETSDALVRNDAAA